MTKRCTTMLAVLFLSIGAFADSVGNGTDPLRFMFEDAKPLASNWVLRAIPCAFGVNVTPEVRGWIMDHQQALADDILATTQNWITDAQSTCAWTQTTSKAPVTLSFDACRPGIRDISDAIKVLIHESVHHFGITDEHFCDDVADSIYYLGSNSTCPIQPAADPFDPASCPGSPLSTQDLFSMIPLPNATEIPLGEVKVYTRSRVCYPGKLCRPWDLHPGLEHTGVHRSNIVLGGDVYARLKNNRVEIDNDFNMQDAGIIDYWTGINVVDDRLNFNSAGWSGFDYTYHNNVLDPKNIGLAPYVLTGKITRTCARQTTAWEDPSVDGAGNTTTTQVELVFLSSFNK
jgi:hypothetical protein